MQIIYTILANIIQKKQILNKNNLDDYKLDKQTLNTKKTILRKYKSQDRVIKMFNHMIPYEDIK